MENNETMKSEHGDLMFAGITKIADNVSAVLEELKEKNARPEDGVQFLANIAEMVMTYLVAFAKEGEQDKFLMMMQLQIYREVLGNIETIDKNKAKPSIILH